MINNKKNDKVLIIRSYRKAPFTVKFIRSVFNQKNINFEQFPPWPDNRIYFENIFNFNKLNNSETAWDDINRNLITNKKKIKDRIASGYYKYAIIIDDEGELFKFARNNISRKIMFFLVLFLRKLLGKYKPPHDEQFYRMSMPFTLQELKRHIPIIGIELRDRAYLSKGNIDLLNQSTLYFKRELPFDKFELYSRCRPKPWSEEREKILKILDKIYCIPLGIEDNNFEKLSKFRKSYQKKDIDICFVGAISNTLRMDGVNILKRLDKSTNYNIYVNDKLPFNEYCEIISNSKIVLSIAGSRWECFRHYEAVALGSIPLINKPYIDNHFWNSMPKNIYFENNFENFEEQIQFLLQDTERYQNIFEELEKKILGEMTNSKIINNMFATIEKCLSKRNYND